MFLSCKNTSNTSKGDNHKASNRKADNATVKGKKMTSNGDKTLHRKLKNQQHEPHEKPGVISVPLVLEAVLAPLYMVK